MKMKKVIVSLMMVMGFLTASAQEQQPQQMENVFKPHWYVQAQGGAQYTLGELDFGDLISPNVQISGGYNFNKLFGLRLSVNAWQSKAGGKYQGTQYDWKWNYVNPNVDAVLNVSNLFAGFNPERLFNLSAYVGIGANFAWGNDDAVALYGLINDGVALANMWDDSKVFFNGRAGLMGDFRITDNWSVGLELNANALSDKYNSKKAGNADWHFNALVGVKYTFGKTHTKRPKAPCCKPEVQIVEKIVEVEKEKIVYKEKAESSQDGLGMQKFERDIFFNINSSKVTNAEMVKVQDIADYLKAHPKAKVTITGHADKNTGNPTINMRISEKRTKSVADLLIKKYGIAADRIITESVGDTEQPKAINDQNRVCVCIAI